MRNKKEQTGRKWDFNFTKSKCFFHNFSEWVWAKHNEHWFSSLNHSINQNVLNRNVRQSVGEIKFQQRLPKCLMKWWIESSSSWTSVFFHYVGSFLAPFLCLNPMSYHFRNYQYKQLQLLAPLGSLTRVNPSTFTISVLLTGCRALTLKTTYHAHGAWIHRKNQCQLATQH